MVGLTVSSANACLLVQILDPVGSELLHHGFQVFRHTIRRPAGSSYRQLSTFLGIDGVTLLGQE